MIFVDSMGEVFIGPYKGEGFRYLRFCGASNDRYGIGNPVGLAVWVWECYDPNEDWERISEDHFHQLLKMYGVTSANIEHLVPA